MPVKARIYDSNTVQSPNVKGTTTATHARYFQIYYEYTYSFTVDGPDAIQYPYLLFMAEKGNFDIDDITLTAVSVPSIVFSSASALLAHYGPNAIATGTIATNNIISISGTFHVDADLNFDHCPHIVCDQNSEIVIDNGKQLSITNGTVMKTECYKDWKGIQTTSGSLLHIDRSEIDNMSLGVRINGNIPFSCTDSRFGDNAQSLVFNNTPSGYTTTVTGNEFYTENPSLLYPGSWPGSQYGIVINDCADLKIGNLSTGAGNSFHDLKTGIFVNNARCFTTAPTTGIELYNNDFNNIRGGGFVQDYPYIKSTANIIYKDIEGAAIYAQSRGCFNTYAIRPLQIDYSPNSTAKFQQCDKNILSWSYPTKVQHANITKGFGILCGSPAFAATKVIYDISNNTLNDVVSGVSILHDHQGSTIANNTITSTTVPPASTVGLSGIANGVVGIFVNQFINSGAIPYQIKDNTININTFSGIGIGLYGTNGYTAVDRNTINIFTPQPPSGYVMLPGGTYGMELTNGRGTHLRGNHINGNPVLTQKGISYQMADIHLSRSPFTELLCNHVNSALYGYLIEGNCQTGVDQVKTNDFSGHQYDMLFRHLGTEGTLGDIGDNLHDNKNLLSTNPAGGVNLYTLSICGKLHRNYLYDNNSWVTTGGNNPTCGYKRLYTNGTQPSCQDISYPMPTPGSIQVHDLAWAENIANNANIYLEQPIGSSWLAKMDLFCTLRRDTAARDSSGILNNFYNQNLHTELGQIAELNEQLTSLAEATDSATFAGNWNAAQAANVGMTATSPQAINEQTINSVYLKFIAKGLDSLNAADSATIAALAMTCPLAGGSAVYKARSLYALYQPLMSYGDIDRCNDNGVFDAENSFLLDTTIQADTGYESQARQLKSDDNVFFIYPNPSKGKITVGYCKGGIMEIKGATSRELLSIKLPEVKQMTRIQIDLSSLFSGLYICRYLIDGHVANYRRLIIINE